MKAVIAIDIGTSSVRAGIVDETLSTHGIAQTTYGLSTPQPGWAEQDPDAIFDALVGTVDACLGTRPEGVEVVGICLDSMMHSFLALDGSMKPITTLWTWADMRAARIAAAMKEDAARAAQVYARTGCPIYAMYVPAKAAWLREQRPADFARTSLLTSIKGYVLYRLTGNAVEDLAIASGYGVLDIEKLRWDESALELAGLPADRMPELVEPMHQAGVLLPELARRWGLGAVPVIAGGSDGPLANVGAGCVQEGDMTITVGTSSAVRMFVARPRVDPDARTWCYYLGDATWVVGGAVNGGASTLAWLRQTFPGLVPDGAPDPHAHLDRMADSVPPGADGLMFAPYLAGERNPGLRGDARGYMAGLSLHHRAEHFVRATMEGIAYQIAWVYDSVRQVAREPGRIRITGGFIGSKVWTQILADVLGRELEVPREKEGSLIGAAVFGLAALIPSVEWRSLAGSIPVERTVTPNLDRHRVYAARLETYRRLYGAISPHFSEILAMQET